MHGICPSYQHVGISCAVSAHSLIKFQQANPRDRSQRRVVSVVMPEIYPVDAQDKI